MRLPSRSGSSPKISSEPLERGETHPIIRIVEDLPAPFGPRKPNASPCSISTSIASTARNGGDPLRPGWIFVKARARTSAVLAGAIDETSAPSWCALSDGTHAMIRKATEALLLQASDRRSLQTIRYDEYS